MIEFKKWPKIPRWLNETYTFTEKLDGTNACIVIDEDGNIAAQSRTRIITLKNDNHGFAEWVENNKEDLLTLGPGYHFGEWWGHGINRGYEIKEKRFSLFRTHGKIPKCCERIPVIYAPCWIDAREILEIGGSLAAPGYMKPEGLVIQGNLSGVRYKVYLSGE